MSGAKAKGQVAEQKTFPLLSALLTRVSGALCLEPGQRPGPWFSLFHTTGMGMAAEQFQVSPREVGRGGTSAPLVAG